MDHPHPLSVCLVLLLSLFFMPTLHVASSLPSQARTLLRWKASLLHTSALSSWSPTLDPCTSWNGIRCNNDSANPAITHINLPHSGLIGTLDVLVLSAIPSLTVLNLRHNYLYGPIPSGMDKFSALISLHLTNNNLSGPIPSDMGNLSALISLYLAANNLSGPIPSDMGKLSTLISLNLAFNNLHGRLPTSLANLQKIAKLDLSFNGLTEDHGVEEMLLLDIPISTSYGLVSSQHGDANEKLETGEKVSEFFNSYFGLFGKSLRCHDWILLLFAFLFVASTKVLNFPMR